MADTSFVITAQELGLDPAALEILDVSADVADQTLVVRFELIKAKRRGTLPPDRRILHNLLRIARAHGASTLRVEANILNADLQRVAERLARRMNATVSLGDFEETILRFDVPS